MATKYKHEFTSEKGTLWKVELFDTTFAGAAIDVRSLAGGFRLSYDSESDDINQPIKASSVTFNMIIEDATMESYIYSIIDRPYGDIQLHIYKNSTIYWAGKINTALLKLEHSYFPYAIEFVAVDGLGDLTKLNFNSANWGSLGTQPTIAQLFGNILGNCSIPTIIGTTNYITTASPIYETQAPTTDDVFNKSRLYRAAFTDDNGDYKLNYHQVLTQLLTAFNCRVMLANGIWKIIDNRFYDYYTTWKEYVYNISGTQQSSSTFNNSIAYNATNRSRVFLADPVIEFDPALKYVEVKQIADFDIRVDPSLSTSFGYGTSGSALFTVRRNELLGCDMSARTYSTLKGGTNKKLRLEFTIENKGIDSKKLRWVNVIIQVSNGVTSKRLSNTYNSFTGVNSTTKNADPYLWKTPSMTEGINIPFVNGQKGKYVIEFPDLPYTDCVIEYFAISVCGDADVVRNGFLSGTTATTIFQLDTTNLVIGSEVVGFNTPSPLTAGTQLTNLFYGKATINPGHTQTPNTYTFGFYDPANTIISGDESSVSLKIDSFTYLPSGVNVDNEGYIYSSTNDDIVVEKYYAENVYFGDGFNIQNKNTLYTTNSFGTILPSVNWTIKPAYEVQNSAPLLEKLTQSILWHQYKALKRYSGTLFTTNFEPYQALIKGSEKLVFVGGEFVAELDEWSGSWAVWIYRPDAYVSGSSGNGTKASNTDITKDIYPHVDFPKLDDTIKVIDSVLGDMNGALSVFRQITGDNEKLILDYKGSDPQVFVQVTGATITATQYKENDIFLSAENGKFWKVINGSITQVFQAQAAGSGLTGSGTTNQIAYFTGASSIGSLDTTTYPSLTELSYVKGVTSAIQTQLNGKVSTIGTIDSQTKSANGLVISGTSLVAQTADASNVGMVSIGTQTFAGAKTFSNAALSSLTISSSNYNAGTGSHLNITPSITANANNAVINAVSISPTLSASTFTGVTLIDLSFGRNNPNLNIVSGNLAFMSAQTTQMVVRSASGGITMLKSKIGTVTGAATNVLDVGGDSLFSSAQATPATATARVQIVGSSATTGSALIVSNSTPTNIIRADNNQDLYLGSSGGKIGFFAVTPIVRPTTTIAGATYASPGAGTNVKTDDTFGGYTIAKVVQALINLGLLT